MLPRPKRSIGELVFISAAIFTLFFVTVHQLSMDGILPGNDPAVHLAMAKDVVANRGITYGEIPWYPPIFHTFLATLLLFVGTVDVLVAGLILKLVVAATNVLILLSTYLLCRKLLG